MQNWSYWNYNDVPPWGDNEWDYSHHHAANRCVHVTDTCSSSDGYWMRHGEPRGADWLAAGYWDPIHRFDDGVIVDPLEILLEDYATFWFKVGKPHEIIKDGGKMIAKAKTLSRSRLRGGGLLNCEKDSISMKVTLTTIRR